MEHDPFAVLGLTPRATDAAVERAFEQRLGALPPHAAVRGAAGRERLEDAYEQIAERRRVAVSRPQDAARADVPAPEMVVVTPPGAHTEQTRLTRRGGQAAERPPSTLPAAAPGASPERCRPPAERDADLGSAAEGGAIDAREETARTADRPVGGAPLDPAARCRRSARNRRVRARAQVCNSKTGSHMDKHRTFSARREAALDTLARRPPRPRTPQRLDAPDLPRRDEGVVLADAKGVVEEEGRAQRGTLALGFRRGRVWREVLAHHARGRNKQDLAQRFFGDRDTSWPNRCLKLALAGEAALDEAERWHAEEAVPNGWPPVPKRRNAVDRANKLLDWFDARDEGPPVPKERGTADAGDAGAGPHDPQAVADLEAERDGLSEVVAALRAKVANLEGRIADLDRELRGERARAESAERRLLDVLGRHPEAGAAAVPGPPPMGHR